MRSRRNYDAAFIDECCFLKKSGKSASEIAAIVNHKYGLAKTRNAIVGLCHRHCGAKPRAGRAVSLPKNNQQVMRQPVMQKTNRRKPAAPDAPVAPAAPDAPVAPAAPLGRFSGHSGGQIAAGPVLPGSLSVPLTDLPAGGCRWPVAETKQHLFCGLPQKPGQSYCPGHAALAFS